MNDEQVGHSNAVSSVEQVLVLLAIVVLYALAAFSALFVLLLLGAPEGDSGSLLAGICTVLVSLVAAISAGSSRTGGRVAIALALAIPAAIALWVRVGG